MQNWMVNEFIRSIMSTSVLYSQRENFRKVVNCEDIGPCSHILACRLYVLIL